jgi:carnitine-CoA ligase
VTVPRYTDLDPSDPGVPLPQLIRRRAHDNPDRVFFETITGDRATYGGFHHDALLWADAFQKLGIGRDNVATLLATSIDAYRVWVGLAWIGATEVPLNTDYRGNMLVHGLTQCDTAVLVTTSAAVPRVVEVADQLPHLHTVVLIDAAAAPTGAPFRVVTRAELLDGAVSDDRFKGPATLDTACIIYTSGTTGPSKGVVDAWPLLYLGGLRLFPVELMDDDEAIFAPAPVYHLSGKLPPYIAVVVGGRVVLRERASLTEMWRDIVVHGCTFTIFSGMMASYIMQTTPVSPDDADGPLRHLVMASPVIAEYDEFSTRFGAELVTGYAMTEVGMLMTRRQHEFTPDTYQSVGRPHPDFEARIVGADDNPVPPGTVGELVVRSSIPGALNGGYFGMPDRTAEAWRNGWFHTGDGLKQDDEGNFYFVDRIKDCIRRRGENISSFEVETAVAQHPAVQDCAVIPVPHPDGGAFDEEVKAVVVLCPNEKLSPEELIEFLAPRMPRFMVPRYVEFVAQLPKTDNMKTRKYELRQNPLNDNTWDREAAGVQIPR